MVPPGDRLVVEMPGGGGYGPPATEPDQVEADLRAGFVSEAAAHELYRTPSRGR